MLWSSDMGQFDPTKGKQALEIRSSLSERRALTDPVLPAHGVDLALAHNRQWVKAHGESSPGSCRYDLCGSMRALLLPNTGLQNTLFIHLVWMHSL